MQASFGKNTKRQWVPLFFVLDMVINEPFKVLVQKKKCLWCLSLNPGSRSLLASVGSLMDHTSTSLAQTSFRELKSTNEPCNTQRILVAESVVDSFTGYSDSRSSVCCRVCLGLESPQGQLSPENALNSQLFIISCWHSDPSCYISRQIQTCTRRGFKLTPFPSSLPLHIDFTLR